MLLTDKPTSTSPKHKIPAEGRQTGQWEAEGVASGYKTFASTEPYTSANRHLISQLAANGISLTGTTVLDLGSGTGSGTQLIAEVVGPTGHVLGIDQSQQMTDFATKTMAGLTNTHFIQGDVLKLDQLHLPSVQGIFAFNSITLFPSLPEVLVTLFELLPPGGVLAVNNTLIQDALDSANMGAMLAFTKRILAINKREGVTRSAAAHTPFPSSCELRSKIERVGFNILNFDLSSFALSREDMRSYAHVPGVFCDILPDSVPQEKRVSLLDEALNLLDSDASFPRRWCSIVAVKPY